MHPWIAKALFALIIAIIIHSSGCEQEYKRTPVAPLTAEEIERYKKAEETNKREKADKYAAFLANIKDCFRTKGRHTYINISQHPSFIQIKDEVDIRLDIMARVEELYPNGECHFEPLQRINNSYSPETWGMWVDHPPEEIQAEKELDAVQPPAKPKSSSAAF